MKSQKKTIYGLVVGIFGFLVFFIATNSRLLHTSKGDMALSTRAEGRGLASIDGKSSAIDLKWEHDLAYRLSQMKNRGPANVAHEPQGLERLAIVELEGKYDLKMKAGKIFSVKNREDATLIPTRISDVTALIEDYKSFWSVDFARVQTQDQNSQQSVYGLLDLQGKKVGQMTFQWDPMGRFLSLEVK